MAKPKKKHTQPVTLPMLPLRGLMVFPYMVLHFDVGRKKSVAALEQAMLGDQRIFLVAQRDMDVDNPDVDIACAVMEALAYETFTHVTPVYFETCLQTKVARNEDTIEMLGIIRDGCCLDVEYLYKSVLGYPNEVMRTLVVVNKSNNVASWYASNEKRIQDTIEKTIQTLEEMQ